MARLQDVEQQLASLSRDDKAKLVKSLVRELGNGFPGIVSEPGVCGGEPCIIRTRIPVWILEQLRRQGLWDAEILGSYPTLRTDDLENAWAYVESHREEIDSRIRDNLAR